MLMVTANGREEAYLEAGEVGLQGFLLKPVYASVMYNTLLDILGIEMALGPLTIKGQNQTVDLGNIQGAHILLVDDNSINQEVANEYLLDVGMVVTIASNGQECLAALQHESFDLVFMDIQMPEMDGLEVTRRIRQDSQFKDLPIIAMTAHAMAGDKEKSLAAGMNGHITKPIDQEILYQTLKEWIPEKQTATHTKISHKPASQTLNTGNVALPVLPGIDQGAALKVLNQNEHLFVKMLYDFQKNFSGLPTLLREWSEVGKWQEIQDKAHAIRGVSGYIGSVLLMQAAQKLEDSLRNGQREEAVNHLVSFIDALDAMLSSLSALPVLAEEPVVLDKQTVGRNIELKEVQDQLQVLIGQLTKGELAAEDQFVAVEQLLAETGFDEELKKIAELIDDIEYEQAAEMAGHLLHRVHRNRED
jgi:two-component system sensor histidine kinase/response regulator